MGEYVSIYLNAAWLAWAVGTENMFYIESIHSGSRVTEGCLVGYLVTLLK